MNKTILSVMLFILAVPVVMADPQGVDYDNAKHSQMNIIDGMKTGDLGTGVMQDTGPPCINFVIYLFDANVTTAANTIVSQSMMSTMKYTGLAINIRQNMYTMKSDFSQEVPVTARDAVIQLSLRDFVQNTFSRANQRMEVAHIAPDLVAGFVLHFS